MPGHSLTCLQRQRFGLLRLRTTSPAAQVAKQRADGLLLTHCRSWPTLLATPPKHGPHAGHSGQTPTTACLYVT